MPALTDRAVTSVDDRCRLCDAVLAAEATVCPKCRLPVRRRTACTGPARPIDVTLSMIMALIALMTTLPPTALAVANAAMSGNWQDYLGRLFGLACWNGIIIGSPIVILARRWVTRVRREDFERAWMWRDYWWLQLMAFSPIFGALLALWTFNQRIDFLWHLFG